VSEIIAAKVRNVAEEEEAELTRGTLELHRNAYQAGAATDAAAVVIPSAWSCHREPTSVGLLLRAIMTDVPPPPPKSPMIVILVIAVAGALMTALAYTVASLLD
jgi:hypothetical protein